MGRYIATHKTKRGLILAFYFNTFRLQYCTESIKIMDYLTKSFWNFSQANKIDVLREPQHLHLIYAALSDRETGIEDHMNGTYTLYGDKEALLVLPQLLTTRLLLCFFSVIKQPQYQ